MKSPIRLRRIFFWPSLLIVAAGCGPTDRGLEPIMEDTSIHSLRDSALQAATAVEAAAGALDDDPARASQLLEEASQSLRQLLEFFIPLQEAREHVYNAYRHLRLDEITSARHELDEAEAHLVAIAQSDEGKLLREMEPLLELLEDARIALQVDPTEASEILRNLANRLNNMVVRGGLVVD
jgi:cellobiose-specific phosphotransferase system component IIA